MEIAYANTCCSMWELTGIGNLYRKSPEKFENAFFYKLAQKLRGTKIYGMVYYEPVTKAAEPLLKEMERLGWTRHDFAGRSSGHGGKRGGKLAMMMLDLEELVDNRHGLAKEYITKEIKEEVLKADGYTGDSLKWLMERPLFEDAASPDDDYDREYW